MSNHLSSVYSTTSELRVPRELEIVLNGPIGPQRLRDDTVVIDGGGWYRTLTPSAPTFSAVNEVLFCNLDQQHTDAHLDKVIAEYHDQGLALSWCVYPWTQPSDLGERLLVRGAEVVKVRAHLGSTALPLAVVEGVDVERVDPESTDGLDTYFEILAAGYGFSADEAVFRRQRYHQLASGSDPVMHLFIARCDGVDAGCTALIVKGNSAHLTTASVLPAFQARGVFQSLIATSLSTLHSMGIMLASGHSNEKSAFWVERFGFKCLYEYGIYELKP